jgi:hypothetical protein
MQNSHTTRSALHVVSSPMRLSTLVVLPLLAAAPGVFADAGLNAPGLMPLINKANTLLSSGKFADAARMYSEAIGESINIIHAREVLHRAAI